MEVYIIDESNFNNTIEHIESRKDDNIYENINKKLKYSEVIFNKSGDEDEIEIVMNKKHTIDKQFEGLIKTAKDSTPSSFLVARDTSGSMDSKVVGLDISSNEVAKSIALYFSYLLEGRFANSYIEFDSKPELRYWEGNSPSDKYLKNTSYAYGSTNFLGIPTTLISYTSSKNKLL